MFEFLKDKSIDILSPLSGKILSLSESPDMAFSQGLLGEGICINPSGNILYAPCNCTIDIFHTLHAISCSIQNIEFIIHIGMNTVSLNGEGFTALIDDLQTKVLSNTPLIEFDHTFLLSKVNTLITPIVIIEKPKQAKIEILKRFGTVQVGEPIIRINL